ncbi:hypothetical protein VTK73DRAFT_8167 [Phialemonium thermophilum]|uniref:PEBP-like protein n=1 Tax=Phialemonium thermophilum TaxID=223376 RepID=A0ABR3WA50_9PEZI
MRTPIFALLSLLSGPSLAQTPPGFTPEVAAHLDVIYGSKAVSPPGIELAKSDVQKQPTIGTSDTVLNGTYLFVMIDLDVPASFTNPSAGPRRTNLHAMITGFQSDGTKTDGGVNVLSSSATGPVRYLGPAPPAETPPHPHRYVQLLFPTPESGFSVSQADVGQSLGFDIHAFIKKKNLDAPVRANYFNVTG